jgi:hypothetical protein
MGVQEKGGGGCMVRLFVQVPPMQPMALNSLYLSARRPSNGAKE